MDIVRHGHTTTAQGTTVDNLFPKCVMTTEKRPPLWDYFIISLPIKLIFFQYVNMGKGNTSYFFLTFLCDALP